MENFYNSLVLAMLGPGANPADPKVALSPQLLYTYKAFVQSQADLAKAYRAAETKEMLGKLKNDVAIFSAAQKAKVNAMQEMAQSSRVSAQNITKIRVAAQKNAERAHEKNTAIDEGMVRQLENKAKATATSTGMKIEQAILHDALNAEYVSADLIDPDNTKANGTVHKVLLDTVKVGLDDPQIVEKVSDYFKGSPYHDTVVNAVRKRKASWDGNEDTIKQAASLNGSLGTYENMIKGTAAGAPGAKKQINEANALMQVALSNYGATLDASAGKAAESMELTQTYFDNFLSQSLKFKEVSEFLADEIMGKDPKGSYRGKLVSGKDFIAWAKDNGFENLGYMKNGVYVEGADDTDAIYLFQYQRKNPDKYRPGIRRDLGDTGTTVKIAKEPSPAAMNQFVQTGDGTFFMRYGSSGEPEYIKKDDPIMQIARQGGVRLTASDGSTLVLNLNYNDFKDPSSELYKMLGNQAEKVKASYEADPEKFKQTFVPRFVKILVDNPVVRKNGEIDEAATFEKLSSLKALGINLIDSDGVAKAVSYEDLQDKLDKFKVAKSNMVIMQPGGDALSKLLGKKSGVGVGVAATKNKPVIYEYANVMRPHASDFRADGFKIRLETDDGYAYMDDKATIVDSVSDKIPKGNRAFIYDDPEKRYDFLKEVEFGVSKDELELKEVPEAETEEEYSSRVRQRMIKAMLPDAQRVLREEEKAAEKAKADRMDETAAIAGELLSDEVYVDPDMTAGFTPDLASARLERKAAKAEAEAFAEKAIDSGAVEPLVSRQAVGGMGLEPTTPSMFRFQSLLPQKGLPLLTPFTGQTPKEGTQPAAYGLGFSVLPKKGYTREDMLNDSRRLELPGTFTDTLMPAEDDFDLSYALRGQDPPLKKAAEAQYEHAAKVLETPYAGALRAAQISMAQKAAKRAARRVEQARQAEQKNKKTSFDAPLYEDLD